MTPVRKEAEWIAIAIETLREESKDSHIRLRQDFASMKEEILYELRGNTDRITKAEHRLTAIETAREIEGKQAVKSSTWVSLAITSFINIVLMLWRLVATGKP